MTAIPTCKARAAFLLFAGTQQPVVPSEFCSLVDLVHQQLTRHIYTLISSQPDEDSENADANVGGTQTGGTFRRV